MSILKNAAGLAGAALVIAAAVPTFASAAEKVKDKVQDVVVRNTDAEPVPVRPTPPPLWQGTSYVSDVVVLNGGCEPLFDPIPAGQTLFINRVVVDFNVAPGTDGSAVLRLHTASPTVEHFIEIPAHPSAPALQVVGLYDRYQGVLEVGQPTTTTPEACFNGSPSSDIAGKLTVLGYLLPSN